MITVQENPFSVDAVLRSVANPEAGAVVVFIGTVRKERGVKALDYEAYDEMAVDWLKTLRDKAVEKFSLTKVSIVHRKGLLKLGERVVIVAVSAPHRQEAFKGCEWLMNEIKKVIPIWKKEV